MPELRGSGDAPTYFWLGANPERLRRYEGTWVVVEGEKIIAHGKDLRQIVEEARRRGITTPYVFYVEPGPEGVAELGL